MSPPHALSIAEQMQLLHESADPATFALQHLGLPAEWRDTNQPGNKDRCQDAVNKVFTLTRADIEADLAARGLQPEQLAFVRTTPGSQDGWYLIASRQGWDFYWQERGYPNALWTFGELEEVRKLLLNQFIPVWLRHLHVPCRTKSGKMLTHV